MDEHPLIANLRRKRARSAAAFERLKANAQAMAESMALDEAAYAQFLQGVKRRLATLDTLIERGDAPAKG